MSGLRWPSYAAVLRYLETSPEWTPADTPATPADTRRFAHVTGVPCSVPSAPDARAADADEGCLALVGLANVYAANLEPAGPAD